MRAIVDGDIVVYRAGFAAERAHYCVRSPGHKDIDFDNARDRNAYIQKLGEADIDVITYREVEPVENALANAKSMLSRCRELRGVTELTTYLTGTGNFRDDLATILKYKGNRDDMVRPTHYEAVRQYIIDHWGGVVVDGMEADDALADAQSDDTVLCSIDKDLLQVPGKHFNFVKEEKIHICPAVGVRKLYQQVLTGDSTDNIPGIKGVGPVKAGMLLAIANDEQEMYDRCVELWDEYLHSGKCDWVEVDADVYYTPWSWTDEVHPLQIINGIDVVDEVLALLRVGGRDEKTR